MAKNTEQDKTGRAFAKRAYSQSVKEVQEILGSRNRNQTIEQKGDPRNELDDALKQFIRSRVSFYLGTASKSGEPYIQHRGGDAGFIEIVDDQTLRIPDFPGNQQYITLGNLAENPNVFLFMMDYENKSRLKIWGTAEIENLIEKNRAIVIKVDAWDLNCPKHIPDYYSMATVQVTLRKLAGRVQELEAEIARLKK